VALPLAQRIQRGIACDLQQPGLQACFRAPPGQRLEGADERFLSQVRGLVGAAEQATEEVEDPRLMDAHQRAERLAITTRGLLDEVLFAVVH